VKLDRSDSNGKRATVPETATACPRGTKLWRANPRSGSGMKEDRQALGGWKRQEVAKTWRRRRSGLDNPTIFSRCLEQEDAEGEETSREEPLATLRFGLVVRRAAL